MSARLQAIRGMNDVLPAETPLWQFLLRTAAEVFSSYGYAELRLPLVERTDLFKRAVGEVTDVVEKEMYSFEDRGGEKLSLRPELTAGVVRAGIEHGLLHNQQQRLWCHGAAFRYERPQAGRYRQFHQLDVEAYGLGGPDVDIELLAMVARLWKKLGLSGCALQINTLGTPAERAGYRAALQDYLRAHLDALDEDSRRRLETNPLRVLDSKVPETQAIVAGAPNLLDHLQNESRAHFDGLQQGLSDLGIAYVVNPRLVRGLDYYTRTVFEWTTDQLGAQAAVCAGGRYDGLVEQLGGSATPGIGFAIGMERLILLLQKQGVSAPESAPQIYVCAFGAQAERYALTLSESLRDALPGLRLMHNAGGGKPAAQFKRADRSGAPLALVIGDDEAAADRVQIKFLRETREPVSCARGECASQLAGLLQLPPA